MLELDFWLQTLLVLALGMLALPALVLALQVVASRLRPRGAAPVALRRPSIAVLVPAHDEEAGIGATLSTLAAQLGDGDRLLVVADNCSDRTAEVAVLHRAEVVVRVDTSRRGKGYALDHGVRHLAGRAPEIVVIVDADCQLQAGALDLLTRRCAASGRPVQALYLMHAPPDAGLRLRLAEFAWVLKNFIRPLGWHRLGLPCQLMGTGMAFPWALLRAAPLASGNLVEDLQLGLDLAGAGAPPLFCADAVVTSLFPASTAGQQAQRTRWEHGHVATLLTTGPRLLAQGLVRRRLDLVAMALDLCVPPLASLCLLVCLSIVVGAVFGAATGRWLPAALGLAVGGLLTVAVLLAWQGHGRAIVSLRELLAAPLYAIAKLPLYLRLLTHRQTEWLRTKRDDSAP